MRDDKFLEHCHKLIDQYAEEISALTPDTVAAFVDDALDVEYLVDASGTFKGALLVLAHGGPDIELDTRAMEIRLRWSPVSLARTIPLTAAGAIMMQVAKNFQPLP